MNCDSLFVISSTVINDSSLCTKEVRLGKFYKNIYQMDFFESWKSGKSWLSLSESQDCGRIDQVIIGFV